MKKVILILVLGLLLSTSANAGLFSDKTTSPDLLDRLIAANKENKKLKEEIKELKALGRNPPCWPKGWPDKVISAHLEGDNTVIVTVKLFATSTTASHKVVFKNVGTNSTLTGGTKTKL